MRILFVAPWLPSRIRPRSYGLLTHLASVHDVWLVALAGRKEIAQDLEQLPLTGMTLVPSGVAKSVGRALARLPSSASLQQAYAAEAAMYKAVRERIVEWRPDALHFNVIRSAGFTAASDEMLPTVMDLDEIRSDYYRLLAEEGPRLRDRLVGRLEASRLQEAEQRAIERSDAVLFSSPLDVPRASGKGLLVRSPHQVRVAPSVGTRAATELLFVGRMSYTPNVSAAVAFAKKVLPGVRRSHPTTTLTIVGERPRRSVRALGSEVINVTGGVEDVSPYYARATVAVVPVFAATGVQMKLIQAFASGVPAVSTRAAARRAGVEPGKHLLVADDDAEWISAITQLLNEPGLAASLAANALTWARQEYSDDRIHEALDAAYSLATLRFPLRLRACRAASGA